MNNTINDLINKGVPIDTPFLLSINVLRTFCKDQKKLEESINNSILQFGNYLSEINLSNYIFYSFAFQIITDQKSLEKKIYFSPEKVPLTLIYSLVPREKQKELKDKLFKSEDQEAYKIIRQRIDKLRKIKKKGKLSKEQVLSMEFPMLNKVYLENKEAIEYLISLADKYSNGKISRDKYLELCNDFSESIPGIINAIYYVVDYYISTGVKKEYTVTKFCNDYADFFDKMIDNIGIFEEYFYNNPLSLDGIEIDKEKFELYLAVKNAITMIDSDDKSKQKYVYFLANYFKENENRKSSFETIIQIEELGDTLINPASVYELYKKILIEYPNIRPVTFSDVDFRGMNLEEVETFIENFLETFSANWDVIPKEEITNSTPVHPYKPHVIDEERLLDLFVDKKVFYADLDPFMCVRGKKTFDGYIGYIFTNGMVVLDKFYQNSKKGIVSKGDAIYCMKVEDFYRLSQYPKSILRKDKTVKVIEHRNGWQDRVLDVIKQNGDGFKTKDEIDKLLNKSLIKENKGGK